MPLSILTTQSKNFTNIFIQRGAFCLLMQWWGCHVAAGLRRAQSQGPRLSPKTEPDPLQCSDSSDREAGEPEIQVSTVTYTLLLGPRTMLLLTMVGLQTFPWLLCYFSAEWAGSFLTFPRLCSGYKTVQHTFTLWVWIPVLCPTWLELLSPFSLWRKSNTETLQL